MFFYAGIGTGYIYFEHGFCIVYERESAVRNTRLTKEDFLAIKGLFQSSSTVGRETHNSKYMECQDISK